MIRVFIIEDHPVVVAGVRNQFRGTRDGIEVTGNASSVQEAIEKGKAETIDLFILDLWLGDHKPEEGLERLIGAFPGKPVIIYTSETAVSWQQRMIRAGAKAFILKSARRQEIKSAIEIVAHGGVITPKALEFQEQRRFAFGKTEGQKRLTPNQISIAKYLAAGLTLKEIADQTGSAKSTVDKTIQLMRSKFHAKTNAELISILKDENIL